MHSELNVHFKNSFNAEGKYMYFYPQKVFIWQNEVGLLWLSLILEHRQGVYVRSVEAIALVKANSTCSIWVKKETTPTMTKNRQTLSISRLWATGSVIEKVCKHTESQGAHILYTYTFTAGWRKVAQTHVLFTVVPKNAHKSSSSYWHISTFFRWQRAAYELYKYYNHIDLNRV